VRGTFGYAGGEQQNVQLLRHREAARAADKPLDLVAPAQS